MYNDELDEYLGVRIVRLGYPPIAVASPPFPPIVYVINPLLIKRVNVRGRKKNGGQKLLCHVFRELKSVWGATLLLLPEFPREGHTRKVLRMGKWRVKS